MTSSRFISLLALLVTTAAADTPRPIFVGTARVKQHMHRTGDLVPGEEDLLKVIVKWDAIGGAEKYELCHQCNNIDEETGHIAATGSEVGGTVHEIGIGGQFECGGQPCKVLPNSPQGSNVYHLRVMKNGEFSPWSRYQNFNVKEPGTFDHEEL